MFFMIASLCGERIQGSFRVETVEKKNRAITREKGLHSIVLVAEDRHQSRRVELSGILIAGRVDYCAYRQPDENGEGESEIQIEDNLRSIFLDCGD
jgi:hypothetical protein